MRDLVIDAGNTRIKAILFENGLIAQTLAGNEEEVLAFTKAFDFQRLMIASTRGLDIAFIHKLENQAVKSMHLQPNTPLPFHNAYDTPQTLGRDRLAAVAGAWKRFPNCPCLVIDAGTCITYDIYLPSKGYVGGAISPGLDMRFRAMADYTFALPLVAEPTSWLAYGTSTQTCLETGVMQSIVYEINGYSEYFCNQNASAQLFLTGGNALSFEKHLKNPTFVHPHLTQEGLFAILEYNMPIL